MTPKIDFPIMVRSANAIFFFVCAKSLSFSVQLNAVLVVDHLQAVILD
jgi:hypothetical protein